MIQGTGSRHTPSRARRSFPAAVLSLLLLFSAGLPGPSRADEDAAARAAELEALRTRIQSLQKSLESTREQQDSVRRALRDAERDISKAGRQLRQLKAKLKGARQRLTVLRSDQTEQVRKIDHLRDQLARDARAAYAMGRQEQVKLLLNQEQPAAVGRMLTYYGYFAEARADRIEAVRDHLAKLDALQREIGAETERLARMRDQQQRNADRLASRQQERRSLMAKLQRDVSSKSSELERLAKDEKQLQSLVQSLQEMLADIPAAIGDQRPFRQRKGALDWPTRGSLRARYGTRRAVGDLRWKGVLIGAPEGADVRVVSGGRVAFSDWLRGFGLLLIVDHGDGYMTLYGYNQALYKEVGEWVETGEVVAAVGDTGGQSQPGLYFELRRKGKPVNPVSWCAGKAPLPLSAGR